jgi:FdhE protein
MVPRGWQALSAARAARARVLAQRWPACREALRFCAAVADFQGHVLARLASVASVTELAALRVPVAELIREHGPGPLRETARGLDDPAFAKALDDYWAGRDTRSPRSLFARIVLQPYAAHLPERGSVVAHDGGRCPRCGHLPQLGVLRAQGDGSALGLVCSLCLHEWPFRRGRCAACGEGAERNLSFFSAPELDHVRVQACETCRRYHHEVDLARQPDAVPDVDELTALPLDVWAREQGYEKQQPNLVGI